MGRCSLGGHPFRCRGRGYVLYLTYKTVLEGGGTHEVYKAVELPLKVSQTAAILEVVHSLVGLVRSPQRQQRQQRQQRRLYQGLRWAQQPAARTVASRIWCLWGIVVAAPDATVGGGIPAKPLAYVGNLPIQLNLISLLTAWCLSEVIRYGFFALKELLAEAPYVSTWLRYSGFILLYPIGVASELTMAWLALPALKESGLWSITMPNSYNFAFSYYVACIIAMLTYIPGLPQLYGYMLANRRKVLGGGAKKKKTA
ncbi:protein tyrosine phosphatase-like (proline instead of catalytic arginine), member b [Monoraphidium neglectum]|uniref:Very-long-chain (3R)-3-hydroxyacyl-CoA dehydratase n=1 Tax=Monoraphidium neglectum TaxID=145388 RepID=A0A0D2M395_9CHLO|nr:protein tyrosine phosphatase-like (proline instead of catalytic arginine), member b [Monoraphidium neglectum]KIY95821.1 protein tyrosine phosphatase-like (proline instead of catalytic arginine), member b [Monoraphidium neglectum]|eukprot:XP_013894841.1 protein tyrosine phosphatase-like (proline instead of catalytic arginine), member b [Monoraphidium neglectum]